MWRSRKQHDGITTNDMKKQPLATQKNTNQQYNEMTNNERSTNNVMEQPWAKKKTLTNKAIQLSNTQQCEKAKKNNEKNTKTIQQDKNDVQNYIKRNPLEIFVCLGVDFFIELTWFSNVWEKKRKKKKKKVSGSQ